MQRKKFRELITKNIKEVVSPVLKERSYEYKEKQIENQITWAFYKIVNQQIVFIYFDTCYEDHITVSFHCPSSVCVQKDLFNLEPDLDPYTAFEGFAFQSEEGLKQVLKQLLMIVLKHEKTCTEYMLSRIIPLYQNGYVKWDGTQWRDEWGEAFPYKAPS